MDDNFDMGSLPTLENLDGSTEEPVTTRSNNYSQAQNIQNNMQLNGYQQNNFSPFNQNNAFQENNFSPVNQNSGYQQNNFNPVNQNLQRQNFQQYNNATNNSFNQRSSDILDSFWSGHNELCSRGEKIAKVIGIILLVISILDALFSLIGGRIIQGLAIGVRIYLAIQFIKGKNSARIYFTVVLFLSAIGCLIMSFATDTLYSAAKYSIEFSLIGFIQGIYVIGALIYGGVAIFIIISKSIEAYFSR